MPDQDTLIQARGLYSTFTRKGGSAPTATHYCPGCGHGILHKLVGEALAELELQDRAVMISPVGCSVFAYYYFDCGNVQAAHGRAAALGTGIVRAQPEAVVVSYQGDGDLCSIGLNETLQAANRGEQMAVFFVNNAVYGMTGGQMAPTTLLGQKTTTSPYGRSLADSGAPIHACELINAFAAPVYIERCSLADIKRIRKARKAVRQALRIQKERKGFAFVELLSPCPTNMHSSATDAADFVTEAMEEEFPLGCLRDTADSAEPLSPPLRAFDKASLDKAFADDSGGQSTDACIDEGCPETRVRVAGFGGQGVLSLGLMLAQTAQQSRRFVTWFPSYGPEQRGGTANCSIVFSGQPIGSPVFAHPHVLVAMNRPSLQKFAALVDSGNGVILYDASIVDASSILPANTRNIAVPALQLAVEAGSEKAANTAMLGVLASLDLPGLNRDAFEPALAETLATKPKLIPINKTAFENAVAWARKSGYPAGDQLS